MCVVLVSHEAGYRVRLHLGLVVDGPVGLTIPCNELQLSDVLTAKAGGTQV